ncbi:AraC family transcriptional regulator [Kribbella sp. NPDC056861]|uniref:AraC family transcriptional regulator n=1 Tax=Kribbella sp. NPDC056861 TaxID=3154857 RepID=UPI0034488CA6
MSRRPEYLIDRLGGVAGMDPLSEMLALLNVEAALPSRLEAAGDWALQFDGYADIKVGAVLAGSCWITAAGSEPLLLATGDCYLVASARAFGAASSLDVLPVDGHAVFEAGGYPETVYYQTTAGAPDQTIIVGGAVNFDRTTAALLLDHLPTTVRIAADSKPAAALRPLLELLGEEFAHAEPGAASVRDQLTKVLFVHALRAMIASDNRPSGWLGALGDPSIGPALELLHRDPARRWTVAELAAKVGLSRSTFALRFKTLVGMSPLDYLARWRIQAAGRALRSTDRTVHSVATEFGYGSESAFSNAFKRVTGESPARHRH